MSDKKFGLQLLEAAEALLKKETEELTSALSSPFVTQSFKVRRDLRPRRRFHDLHGPPSGLIPFMPSTSISERRYDLLAREPRLPHLADPFEFWKIVAQGGPVVPPGS